MAKKKPAAAPASAPPIPEQAAPRPPEEPIAILPQEYKILDVQLLKLHPKNPKKGNVEAIEQSLEANDFYGAVYVQKSSMHVLKGNHTLKASIAKGMREIPVIVVDCDDATAERILLADNRIADLGTYDESKIVALLEERARSPRGLEGTGYGEADLERMKLKMQTPTQFPTFDETVSHSYTCPRCNFHWS